MNKKRVDIMVDIETLGKSADATIIQISAIGFNIETGEYYSHLTFDKVADIEKNERPLKIEGGTLKWWLNTDKELLNDLINGNRSESLSSEDVIREFYKWVEDIVTKVGRNNTYLWGNGILFDNRIIQHQMESLGLNYPIYYRNDRDVRTLLEIASLKTGASEKDIKDKYMDKTLVAHNALHDVKNQIALCIGCYNLIAGKGND